MYSEGYNFNRMTSVHFISKQTQAKLESEVANLKEQNEKTRQEANNLQEKFQGQVKRQYSGWPRHRENREKEI